jgi:hypothetical protein
MLRRFPELEMAKKSYLTDQESYFLSLSRGFDTIALVLGLVSGGGCSKELRLPSGDKSYETA